MYPDDSLCIQRLAKIPFKKIEGGFKLKNNFQEMGLYLFQAQERRS